MRQHPENEEDNEDLVMGGVAVGKALADSGKWAKVAGIAAVFAAIIALATLIVTLVE